MKLHFEHNLDYQHDAIEAVCDLFKGQETCRTEFTVTHAASLSAPELAPGFAQNELGIGNRLTLLDEELLANLRDVQLRNGLRPSVELSSGDFTIEMERLARDWLRSRQISSRSRSLSRSQLARVASACASILAQNAVWSVSISRIRRSQAA